MVNFDPIWSGEVHKVPFVEYYMPENVQIGKVKLLLGEVIDYKFKRACVAEFLAMMFFVVMCCGCAMVSLLLKQLCVLMDRFLVVYQGKVTDTRIFNC